MNSSIDASSWHTGTNHYCYAIAIPSSVNFAEVDKTDSWVLNKAKNINSVEIQTLEDKVNNNTLSHRYSYDDSKSESFTGVNSFTNPYALYSPEYVLDLCQVSARTIDTNLLDLASNLGCTNIGQKVGTCKRQSDLWLEGYGLYCSGPGIGPHNSVSQVLNIVSHGSGSEFMYNSASSSSYFSFNNNCPLYDTKYDIIYDNSSTLDVSPHCNVETDALFEEGGNMAMVWPASREFGFMPNNIPKFVPAAQSNVIPFINSVTWVNEIHTEVARYEKPNYLGAQIRVPSGLNIESWKYILKNYDLKILGQYLEYGFPLNLDYNLFQYNETVDNHKSALQNPSGVVKYFATEVQKEAMAGPFDIKPFSKTHFSPLMARDKPDGGVRVIVDLSWPIGRSVNSCIPDNMFENINFVLKYPSIDMIIQKIRQLGPKALLFKIDLERAFRNLRMDPLDYPVLGLRWGSENYVDLSVPFGMKSGAAACQMTTDVITHALRSQKIWIINYLDDYLGVATPELAESHFSSVKNILADLGLPINYKKLEPPSQSVTCLGILINAKDGIISIPDDKLQNIKSLCSYWSTQVQATRNQLQKLTGKLLYIHRCVKPSRIFLNRILQVLRNTPVKGSRPLPLSFYKDLAWFNAFLDIFNGSVEIHTKDSPKFQVFVDASLHQVGAYADNEVYVCDVLQSIKNVTSIVHLEAANIVLAVRVWCHKWRNANVTVYCDNMAVVNAFQNNRIRDPWLMACTRTLWYYTAAYNININVRHIYGVHNVYADTLSRWEIYQQQNGPVVQYLKKCKWKKVTENMLFPNFQI